jgi:hypothetical protein
MGDAKSRAKPIALLALLASTGCASDVNRPVVAGIRPVSDFQAVQVAADEGEYQDAVKAILRRDYGLALEFLQAARAREPRDVRVLNAFGVVYDKLGRFDLSAGYYREAAAIQPDSKIVQQNVAYSHVLQGEADAIARPTVLARNAPPPRKAEPAVMAAAGGTAAPSAAPAAVIALAPRDPVRPVRSRSVRLTSAVLDEPTADSLPVFQLELAREVIAPHPAAAEPARQAAIQFAHRRMSVAETPEVQASRPARLVLETRPAYLELMLQQASYEVRPAARVTSPPARHEAERPPRPAAKVRKRPAQEPVRIALAAHKVEPGALARQTRDQHLARPQSRKVQAIARTRSGAVLLGEPVVLVNATGRRWGADAVRRRLGHMGWSTRDERTRPGSQAVTTIEYRWAEVAAARALARTLPGRSRLVACRSCTGVRLVVGSDAAQWRLRPWRHRARYHS